MWRSWLGDFLAVGRLWYTSMSFHALSSAHLLRSQPDRGHQFTVCSELELTEKSSTIMVLPRACSCVVSSCFLILSTDEDKIARWIAPQPHTAHLDSLHRRDGVRIWTPFEHVSASIAFFWLSNTNIYRFIALTALPVMYLSRPTTVSRICSFSVSNSDPPLTFPSTNNQTCETHLASIRQILYWKRQTTISPLVSFSVPNSDPPLAFSKLYRPLNLSNTNCNQHQVLYSSRPTIISRPVSLAVFNSGPSSPFAKQ